MSSIANALETLVYNGLSAEDVLYNLSKNPRKIKKYKDDLGYEWMYILSGRAVHHLLARNEHMTKYVPIYSSKRLPF
jgi:hypothetical protein